MNKILYGYRNMTDHIFNAESCDGLLDKIADCTELLDSEIMDELKDLSGSFESCWEKLITLSLHYYYFLALRNFKDEKYSKKLNSIKNEILGLIKKLQDYGVSGNFNEWIGQEKNENKKNTRISYFSDFINGENTQFFDSNLYAYLKILNESTRNSCKSDEVCLSLKELLFIRFVSTIRDYDSFMNAANECIREYWAEFIECHKAYRLSMAELRPRITERIYKRFYGEGKEIAGCIFLIMGKECLLIDEFLWFRYLLISLYDFKNEEFEKFDVFTRLISRVFENQFSADLRNGYSENKIIPDYYLFLECGRFIADFQKYYCTAICMFLLLQNISYEHFCLIFNENNSPEKNSYDIFNAFKVGSFLDRYKTMENNSPDNALIKKLYTYYSEEIEGACEETVKYICEREKTGQSMRTGTYKLMQSMMFFAVMKLCGSYIVDEYSISCREEGIDKKYRIEKPLWDALEDGSWYGSKKQRDIYNHIAREFDFIKLDENDEMFFGIVNYSELKNRRAVMNLLYNLSRSSVYEKEALMNQMNYTRSQQTRLLYIQWDKNGGYKDFDDAEKKQKLLKKIDTGFLIKNYEQKFFPFSVAAFREKFGNRINLVKEIECRFCCETDNVVSKDSKSKKIIDWRQTNRKGMKCRYLYKDRNIETHYGQHTAVSNLLKPSAWENLIWALDDFQTEVLGKLWEEEYAKHDYVYNPAKKDPVFFILGYLLEEATDLRRILKMKICSAAGMKMELFTDTDNVEQKYKEFIKEAKVRLAGKVPDYEFHGKIDIRDPELNSDDLFLLRLEDFLNLMFSINESNEAGFDHKYTDFDFYEKYYAQTAFYLMYLTLKFEKLENSISINR